MDTIFMNFKNSEKSGPHRLLLNLTDKINLINMLNVINMLLYQTLAFTMNGKYKKAIKK